MRKGSWWKGGWTVAGTATIVLGILLITGKMHPAGAVPEELERFTVVGIGFVFGGAAELFLAYDFASDIAAAFAVIGIALVYLAILFG